ncbi:ABC transporter permease [Trueperella pecoris]|uniref:ABC transporter permease n=1 Tax=Trueperella pecoris TaxID=2733571 RepID=A0A7M1QYZ0_9ACTO|nr:ABC transporter permease [Trueperella pecoris]QOR47302.1 ABC transporter permease [Trueperella pecoris]
MNLFLQAFAWLTDPANWAGASGIWARLGQHLAIVGVVLVIAGVIALPVGVAIGHARRGEHVIAAIAGAARAIPTLGLLTVLGLMLGIGLAAPTIVLVVLAIPPMLAGAYSGVANVDSGTVKAARAIGMSRWQTVTRVELPLAAPIIVGGIRSAVVQVIATATLAAYIADAGLGRFIFSGLSTRRYDEMLGAAVVVIALALVADLAFAGGLAYTQRRSRVRAKAG